MDSSNDAPKPDQPPINVSDQEVERILQEVEALANEIVETGDLDRPRDESATMPVGQFGVIEPDPLAAIELVAASATEVTQALGSAVATPACDIADVSAHEDRTSSMTETRSSIDQLDPEISSADLTDSAPRSLSPEPEQRRARDTTPSSTSESTELNVDDAVSAPTAPTSAPDASLEGPPRSNARNMRDLPRAAAVALPNAVMRLVIASDRPFAWISPAGKNTIGLLGLMTLVMGLASILLPRMLERNPYAVMEPLPKMADAPAEHGENHSEHQTDADHGDPSAKPNAASHH